MREHEKKDRESELIAENKDLRFGLRKPVEEPMLQAQVIRRARLFNDEGYIKNIKELERQAKALEQEIEAERGV